MWFGHSRFATRSRQRRLHCTSACRRVRSRHKDPEPGPRCPESWHSCSRLGNRQQTLLALIEQLKQQPEFEEVLSCWVQELVVRGNDFACEPTVTRLWTQLEASDHPLAVLPLHTVRLEAELKDWLPQERVGGSSWSMPFGPSDQARTEAEGPLGRVAPTEFPAATNITAVVANWAEESNGRSEAKRFRFDSPTRPSAVSSALLRALPLLCLEGAAVEQIMVRAVATERALSILFSASANGGAYNHGRRAAHGRLELWHSVAAMIGHQSTDVRALAETAANWRWYSFEAASDWFEQVAWDLGMVALSPDATDMSVLAATDTD